MLLYEQEYIFLRFYMMIGTMHVFYSNTLSYVYVCHIQILTLPTAIIQLFDIPSMTNLRILG